MLGVTLMFVTVVTCSDADGIRLGYSDNLRPYQAHQTGPYWTYPVRKYADFAHRSDLFDGSDFEEFRLRFKRDANSYAAIKNSRHDYKNGEIKHLGLDLNNGGSGSNGKFKGEESGHGFVPQQFYSQVRRYDRVSHLPRSAALAEASTPEEVANAPRLREVLSHKLIQQVYEEKGYEDSGYDHGAYNHEGAKYEDVEKNEDLQDRQNLSDSVVKSTEDMEVILPISDEMTTLQPLGVSWKSQKSETNKKSTSWGDGEEVAVLLEEAPSKLEDVSGKYVLIDGKRVPVYKNTIRDMKNENKTTLIYFPDKNLSGKRQREKLEESGENVEIIETAETRRSIDVGNVSDTYMEGRVINDPRPKGSNEITFPGRHTRRKYAIGRPSGWTPMAPDVFTQESIDFNVRRPLIPAQSVIHNIHHYVPYIPKYPSYYSDPSASFSSPGAQILNPPQNFTIKQQNIPVSLMAIGPLKLSNESDTQNSYSNSVKVNETTTVRTELMASTMLPEPFNNESIKFLDIAQPRINHTMGFLKFPQEKYRKNYGINDQLQLQSVRRKHYNNFTRVNMPYDTTYDDFITNKWTVTYPSFNIRHPSIPRDSGNTESVASQSNLFLPIAAALKQNAPQSRMRAFIITNDSLAPAKYIERLTVAHYSSADNSKFLKTVPQVQNERIKELARQLNAQSDSLKRRNHNFRYKRDVPVYDKRKYPFYKSGINRNKDSALNYATNPADVPKKTKGGMEFYESRDALVKCPEPTEPEETLPEVEDEGEWKSKSSPDSPRLKGLGEKIECLKTKYFGKEPLDNPFFQEGDINEPPPVKFTGTRDNNSNKGRKTYRNTNKRLMIIPNKNVSGGYFNYSKGISNSHSEGKNSHSEYQGNAEKFPYKNHKPETASVSPSVYNLRITNPPYQYYGGQNNKQNTYSTYENPDEGDAQSDYSKKRPYYFPHYHHRHKHFHKKRRHRPHRHPVSIYSIISSNGFPSYYRPLIYAHSIKSHKVIPIYEVTSIQPSSDNVASDSEDTYQIKPSKFYIVRPGEYTENKDIALDKKESSSIWNYINPFKWWFPSFFDTRRKEPRYRRRRSPKTYDKILHKEARKLDDSDELRDLHFELPYNHKLEPAIIPSTPSSEDIPEAYTADLETKPSRLNRLTGGYLNRNNSHSNMKLYSVMSTTPSSTEPSSRSAVPTTVASKIHFPYTGAPKRRYKPVKKSEVTGENENNFDTITSTPIVPGLKVYKPKRVADKNVGNRGIADPYITLKRQKPQQSAKEFPNSSEELGSSEGKPRQLQNVEHRRVTKQETFKTSYIPEDEIHANRDSSTSGEEVKYSVSNSNLRPSILDGDSNVNKTLTYMVNPATGVGTWNEQPKVTPRKPHFKRIKKYRKKTYKSLRPYPTLQPADTVLGSSLLQEPTEDPPRISKVQRHISQSGKEAYILSLLSKIPPNGYRSFRKGTLRDKSTRHTSPQLIESSVNTQQFTKGYEDYYDGNFPPPTKGTPQFILEPDKRKYYYAEE